MWALEGTSLTKHNWRLKAQASDKKLAYLVSRMLTGTKVSKGDS